MNFISKCKRARGHINIAPADIFKTCLYEKVAIKVDIVWTSHHIAVNGLTNKLEWDIAVSLYVEVGI